MKKYYFAALLVAGLCATACSDKDDKKDEPIEEPCTVCGKVDCGGHPIIDDFKIDWDYFATKATIQNTWAGEYEGWDAKQEATTKIKRKLTLNANGTYTNEIYGILTGKEGEKNDYYPFEKEKGTYVYNASTRTVTYTVQYDSLIDYQTLHFIGYSKKHYYSSDGKNASDKKNYTEEALFTQIGEQGAFRKWVSEDTYLQQLTDKELDLYFTMDVFSGEDK